MEDADGDGGGGGGVQILFELKKVFKQSLSPIKYDSIDTINRGVSAKDVYSILK